MAKVQKHAVVVVVVAVVAAAVVLAPAAAVSSDLGVKATMIKSFVEAAWLRK